MNTGVDRIIEAEASSVKPRLSNSVPLTLLLIIVAIVATVRIVL